MEGLSQGDHGRPWQQLASKGPDARAYYHGVKLDFIRAGEPVKNAVIVSFDLPAADNLSMAG